MAIEKLFDTLCYAALIAESGGQQHAPWRILNDSSIKPLTGPASGSHQMKRLLAQS